MRRPWPGSAEVDVDVSWFSSREQTTSHQLTAAGRSLVFTSTDRSYDQDRPDKPNLPGKGTSSPVYATPVRLAIRMFAGLRERAGTDRREVELAAGATVAD